MDKASCYACGKDLTYEDHHIYNGHHFCSECLLQELEADGKIVISHSGYQISESGEWVTDIRKLIREFPEVIEVTAEDF